VEKIVKWMIICINDWVENHKNNPIISVNVYEQKLLK
jgi:hypothetical protein